VKRFARSLQQSICKAQAGQLWDLMFAHDLSSMLRASPVADHGSKADDRLVWQPA